MTKDGHSPKQGYYVLLIARAAIFAGIMIICFSGCMTFDYNEFVKSDTAKRRGIENIPSDEQTANGRLLYKHVLNPLKQQYPSLRVTSAFRTQHLNEAVGGVYNSQHMKGQAVDFIVYGVDHKDVIAWIKENLDYDQLMDEPGWIHISYNHENNRNQFFDMR